MIPLALKVKGVETSFPFLHRRQLVNWIVVMMEALGVSAELGYQKLPPYSRCLKKAIRRNRIFTPQRRWWTHFLMPRG